MDFTSFLILLVVSLVVSAIFHFGLKYYVRPGINSFISKIIFGWVGAWLGTPVFGRWFDGLNYQEVFYIPAILGSCAILIMMVDLVKSFKAA